MDTAEDDEIILQEVIVEQNNIGFPTVARSDILQMPGTVGYSEPEKQTSKFRSRIRSLSPKIAPKFPREKLKSMFRKRKLSTALMFHKLKGVRFSRDTQKTEESENKSLLNVQQEPIEVSITLSTPELTEIEKETGIHPYYFTQQAIISGKKLVTGRAITIRQASLTRSESEEENISKCLKVMKQIPRCRSLPILQQSDSSDSDPVTATPLKKIIEVKKAKAAAHRHRTKKKSPSPETRRSSTDQHIHIDPQGIECISDTDLSTRRNTLPQITVTIHDRKTPDHLDLATHSSQSSSQSSDSGARGSIASITSKSVISPPDTQASDTSTLKKTTIFAKPSDLHSKQKKDTTMPTKAKVTLKKSKEKISPEKTATEEPPKLPPRMPIPGAKVIIPEKIAPEDIQDLSHSKPKKTVTHQTKYEEPITSKDEPIKPPEVKTLKQGFSQTISELPSHSKPKKTLTHQTKFEVPTTSKDEPIKQSELVTEPSQTIIELPSSKASDDKAISEKLPELHSKATTTPSKPVSFETTTWKEEAAKKSQLRRKSPPPPKRSSPQPHTRPASLLLAKAPDLLMKRGSISGKKIAGIQLAPKIPSPESPTADIPSPYRTGRTPLLPSKPAIKQSEPSSSDIPGPSKDTRAYPKPVLKTSQSLKRPQTQESAVTTPAQVPTTKADTIVKIYDSQEDLRRVEEEEKSETTRPPDAPKRHIQRQSSRAKK